MDVADPVHIDTVGKSEGAPGDHTIEDGGKTWTVML